MGNIGRCLVRVTRRDGQSFILRESEVAVPGIDHMGAVRSQGEDRDNSIFFMISFSFSGIFSVSSSIYGR